MVNASVMILPLRVAGMSGRSGVTALPRAIPKFCFAEGAGTKFSLCKPRRLCKSARLRHSTLASGRCAA